MKCVIAEILHVCTYAELLKSPRKMGVTITGKRGKKQENPAYDGFCRRIEDTYHTTRADTGRLRM